MQGDGNLVIYAPGGQPVWASDTWQHPGSHLVVQDDGNVVIYRPDGTPVWATNTWLPHGPAAQGDDMQPGEVLNPDQSITSANGRYTLRLPGRREPGALPTAERRCGPPTPTGDPAGVHHAGRRQLGHLRARRRSQSGTPTPGITPAATSWCRTTATW